MKQLGSEHVRVTKGPMFSDAWVRRHKSNHDLWVRSATSEYPEDGATESIEIALRSAFRHFQRFEEDYTAMAITDAEAAGIPVDHYRDA